MLYRKIDFNVVKNICFDAIQKEYFRLSKKSLLLNSRQLKSANHSR